MKVDNVILLEDNKKYLLLDETELDNKKYFYAVEVTDDKLEPTDNFAFLEEKIANQKVYVSQVQNQDLITSLLIIFTNNVGLEIDKLEN